MGHKVSDWMSSPVVVVDKDSSVSYALTLMRRRNIHSVVIQNSDNNYNILTITDIRDKIIAKEQNPKEIMIKEIMTNIVITADPDWTLKECSIQMQKHNINHLPVVNQNQDLLGIISVTDLFFAAEEIGWGDTD